MALWLLPFLSSMPFSPLLSSFFFFFLLIFLLFDPGLWWTRRHEPGLGYTVRVTDRNSSISQSSFPFQVLSALPSNSSEEASPEYRDEVGGAEGVADMGLAMLVVATVCGEGGNANVFRPV